MKYPLILLLTILLPTITIAEIKNGKFVFHCTPSEKANACNDGCIIQPMIKDIRVNVDKNVVMITSYLINDFEKPFLKPDFKENCVILDDDNWKCTTDYGNGKKTNLISKDGIIVSTKDGFADDGIGVCYKKAD